MARLSARPRVLVLVPALSAALVGACSEKLVVRTVSDRDDTTPVPGVAVQVNDQAWASTDANGEASFDHATAPFVIRTYRTRTETIAATSERIDEVSVVHGNESPAVVEVDGYGVANRGPSVSGALLTGHVLGASGAAGTTVRVVADSSWPSDTRDAFGADTWWTGTTHEVVVRAFEIDVDDPTVQLSPPRHFRTYGETRLTVTSPPTNYGEPQQLGDVDVTLDSAPGDVRVVGHVSQPAAFAGNDLLVTSSLYAPLPDQGPNAVAAFRLGRTTVSAGSTNVDFVFPDTPGFSRGLGTFTGGVVSTMYERGSAGASCSLRLGSTTSSVELAAPAPVELLAPASDGALEDANTFRWSPPPEGGVTTLHAVCAGVDQAGVPVTITYKTIEADGDQAILPVPAPMRVPSGLVCRAWAEWRNASGACQSWSDARELTRP